MYFGSSSLTMILVNKLSLVLLFLLAGCIKKDGPNVNLPPLSVDNNTQYENFFDAKINIEIEGSDGTVDFSQFFYNIPLKNITIKNPIILNNRVTFKGKVLDENALLFPEINEKKDPLEELTEVWAQSVTNDIQTSINSKTKKTFLSENMEFNFELIEGASYFITINPHGKNNHAPARFYIENVKENMEKEFSLSNNRKIFSGIVKNIEQDFIENTQIKLGLYHERFLVSSVGVMDKNGKFRLELSDEMNNLSGKNIYLRTSCTDDDSKPCPKINQKIMVPTNLSEMDSLTIDLNYLINPFSMKFSINGYAENAIKDSVLILFSNFEQGEISIKGKSDDKGEIVLPKVYEGLYSILILPPLESDLSSQLHENIYLKKDEENEGLRFTLLKKQTLKARVLDFNNQPIENAQVEFVKIEEKDSVISDNFLPEGFSLKVITNKDGLICHRNFGLTTVEDNECDFLNLDDGKYMIHIIPPIGSKLPHSYYELIFPKDKKVDIVVSKPVKFSGKVLKSDSLAQPNAYVTIYASLPGFLAHNIVLANTITDSDGIFEVFLTNFNVQ